MATILIVDDRPSNRQFLVTLLGYLGHHMLEAGDGAEALRLVSSAHPALVITDILMPTMDGFEFVNRLRADPALAATPVIFYSATYSEPQAKELAASCGVHSVLPKPSDPEEILAAVNAALGADASTLSPPPAEASTPPKPLDATFAGYLRDLQGVHVKFDEMIQRSTSLRAERERVGALSKEFARNVARLQRITMRLSALVEVGLALNAERDPGRLVHLFFAAACDIVDARHAAVGILDDKEAALRHVYCREVDEALLRRPEALSTGLLGSLLAERRSVRDAGRDGAPCTVELPAGHPPVSNALALSIASSDRIYGWLYFADRIGESAFSEEDERLAGIMAAELALRYEHAILYATVQRHAAALQLEVAERRRAQNALLEREAGLHRAQVMAKLAHVITGPRGEFLEWSETFAPLIGVDSAAVPMNTKGWLELVHPEDRAMFRSRTLEAGRRGAGSEIEYRLRRNGEWMVLRQTMEPLAAARESGRFRWFNTIQDISEQKRAADALAAAESKYRSIFENSVEGIFQTTLEGRVVSANPAAARMLRYATPDQLISEILDLGAQLYAAAADRERFVRLLDAEGAVHAFETRFKRRDGTMIWVSLSASIEAGEQGGSRYLLGSIQDISGRRAQQERIEQLSRVQAMLGGINALIVRAPERADLFREACRIAVGAGRFALAWIGVVDRDADRIRVEAWEDNGAGHVKQMPLGLVGDRPIAQGLAGRAVAEGRPVVANDIEAASVVLLRDAALEHGLRAMVVLPLSVSGEVAAVLALYADRGDFFDAGEMRLLNELAGDLSYALDHLEKAHRLDYLAFYDSLTGMANRALFGERLTQYARAAGTQREKLTLVLADVERLRTVNDSLGRQFGDALLKDLAGRLAAHADPADLARLGGDLFAIVLRPVRGRSEALRRIESLLQDCVARPFPLDGTEVRVSLRIGAAHYPHDGIEAEVLLRNAEAALRSGKDSGERITFHKAEMTQRSAGQLTLETRLRDALQRDQFVLHYQPKVDLDTRRIVGAEALLRWQSPDEGLVPPGRFIPLLEETGMILAVGAWALRRAVLDHRHWLRQGLAPPRIAVNVSAIQLRQSDFVEMVGEAIAQGANPPGIDLEITESLLMRDVEDNIRKLRAVRELGMQIAIDDFGTGYSSLAYLARLPVNALKIDRSFITGMLNDPDTMTLIQTMISLAHSLRLEVIAEGVEEEEQARLLRLLRCNQMQGYLYSRPVPIEEFTPLLRMNSDRA